MYLPNEQFQTLLDIKKDCVKKEGTFKKSFNGRYTYIPSEAYVKMKENVEKITKELQERATLRSILHTCKNSLNCSFTGRKKLHNKIKFVAYSL